MYFDFIIAPLSLEKIITMRYLSVLIFLFTFGNINAQNDSIFRLNGEILVVTISEIDESHIKYKYPKENHINSISKSQVRKIRFTSGRIESYAPALNISNIKSGEDWESVQISNIPSEVIGMYKIDDVSVKATGGASIGKLQSRALNKIKMQTAMIGGNTCYISHQTTLPAGYGSNPGVIITAIAYTSMKAIGQDINFGKYILEDLQVLKTNSYEIESDEYLKPKECIMAEKNYYVENEFPYMKMKFKDVAHDIEEYRVIYSDDSEIILSGFYTSTKGKQTFYNLFLRRIP